MKKVAQGVLIAVLAAIALGTLRYLQKQLLLYLDTMGPTATVTIEIGKTTLSRLPSLCLLVVLVFLIYIRLAYRGLLKRVSSDSLNEKEKKEIRSIRFWEDSAYVEIGKPRPIRKRAKIDVGEIAPSIEVVNQAERIQEAMRDLRDRR